MAEDDLAHRRALEDEWIAVRCQLGERAAFDELIHRWHGPIWEYVRRLSDDDDAAHDIAQDIWLRVLRGIGRLRDPAKLRAWLFGIAHQKCIQLWRKKNRAEAALEELSGAPPELGEDPRDLLIRREQEEQFMKLVEQLPLPQRSVLLLRFVEDFSLEEIAGITGASTGTVKSRLHYAKRALKKLLEENPE